jgi:hypothetical protein
VERLHFFADPILDRCVHRAVLIFRPAPPVGAEA